MLINKKSLVAFHEALPNDSNYYRYSMDSLKLKL